VSGVVIGPDFERLVAAYLQACASSGEPGATGALARHTRKLQRASIFMAALTQGCLYGLGEEDAATMTVLFEFWEERVALHAAEYETARAWVARQEARQ